VPNYIDLVMLSILLVGAFIGYKKGFLRMTFDVLTYVISWIIAIWGYKYLTAFLLSSYPFRRMLEEFVDKNIIKDDAIIPTVPIMFKGLIENTSSAINNTLKEAVLLILANFISIIIIFFVSKIAIMLIKHVLGVLRKVPIFGTIDGFGGLVIGVCIAMMFVYIVLAVIYFFPNASWSIKIMGDIKKSFIVSELYDNNLLINVLRDYLKLKI